MSSAAILTMRIVLSGVFQDLDMGRDLLPCSNLGCLAENKIRDQFVATCKKA